jgi:hypothetical protein
MRFDKMHAIYTTLAVTVMIIVSDWIQRQIYRQYMYIFSEIQNLFVRASETGRKVRIWRAFLSHFAANANEFYIFRQCMYNVFILRFQKSKATAKLSKMGRNKPRAHRFL